MELVYKDLSYRLVGLAYKIDNELGFGYQEKIYSKAFEKLLILEQLHFKKELYAPIKVDDQLIAKRYLDFLVDDKIVVELKVGSYAYKESCNQVLEYLRVNKLKLGIIIRFCKTGVQTKRILNVK